MKRELFKIDLKFNPDRQLRNITKFINLVKSLDCNKKDNTGKKDWELQNQNIIELEEKGYNCDSLRIYFKPEYFDQKGGYYRPFEFFLENDIRDELKREDPTGLVHWHPDDNCITIFTSRSIFLKIKLKYYQM